jgi:16S rRNA processing protein RimM
MAPGGGGAQARLSAGRVGKAHGLDGSFYVTRPRPGVLVGGLSLVVAGRQATVRRCAGTAEKPILAVEGVFTRSDVEALRGEDLWVAREDAPPLEPGAWWAEDFEGCLVSDGPITVGRVRRMLELPSCEVLEVAREGGGPDLLVPLVGDAVRELDVAGGRVEVDLDFLGERPGD